MPSGTPPNISDSRFAAERDLVTADAVLKEDSLPILQVLLKSCPR